MLPDIGLRALFKRPTASKCLLFNRRMLVVPPSGFFRSNSLKSTGLDALFDRSHITFDTDVFIRISWFVPVIYSSPCNLYYISQL